MSRYAYIAKSLPGKTIQADIEAESEQDAITKLTKMGYFPVSVSSEVFSSSKQGIWRLRRVSNKELALFTSQLSSLIESGTNIINAINIVANQTNNKYLKAILGDVVNRIKDGQSLSDSLASHPYLFSGLYSAMIKIGEASGNLKDVLQRLTSFFEKEEEFKSSLYASLTYPFFILVVGILSIAVLLLFVIPKLVAMFEDMGQVLPLATRVLIDASNFLRGYWWIISIGIFILILLLRRLFRSPQGRIFWDKLKLKLPIFGPIILKSEISRLTRTLSLLISSGAPITPALDISSCVVVNQILKSEVNNFKKKINEGLSLSDTLKNSKFFTDFATSIIAIGEETGSLEKSLARIADDYEKEVNNTLKALARLLEPVIILIMGLVVGFIVLAMLLPIFQINLIVK